MCVFRWFGVVVARVDDMCGSRTLMRIFRVVQMLHDTLGVRTDGRHGRQYDDDESWSKVAFQTENRMRSWPLSSPFSATAPTKPPKGVSGPHHPPVDPAPSLRYRISSESSPRSPPYITTTPIILPCDTIPAAAKWIFLFPFRHFLTIYNSLFNNLFSRSVIVFVFYDGQRLLVYVTRARDCHEFVFLNFS